ncbi:MAG: ATP-binding cassette domain-containing protein [Chloroflexota bacterium]|nr:ATP-binding cassette domain-containing protein [Chloroflexota bacterium]
MATNAADEGAVLEVRNLKKYYPVRAGLLRREAGQVKAVDDISFDIPAQKTLGLVGESGCGKTTAAHTIMRGLEPTGGHVIFHDPQLGAVDLSSADKETLFKVRKNMQMVFQDPQSSLNPRMTLLDLIGEPLTIYKIAKGQELIDRVAELLKHVGLRPEYMRRFPHAFSGGQRQRIGIARALALNPRFIVADEPTSALDVSIQAQTLNLLQDLQDEFSLSYLFIAHDLSVVEHISDFVAVMYVGKIVEQADTRRLYHNPKHPYTEALLSSIPRPDPKIQKRRVPVRGELPNPADPPTGCYFHPRCPYAEAICSQEEPPLQEVEPGHVAACHFSDKLTLRGVNDF